MHPLKSSERVHSTSTSKVYGGRGAVKFAAPKVYPNKLPIFSLFSESFSSQK